VRVTVADPIIQFPEQFFSKAVDLTRNEGPAMSVRLQITAMVFMMVQAILFGAGTITMLLTPLQDQAFVYMPAMIVATMLIAAVLSWEIAPRLQARYWRKRGVDHDIISG
jgi:hypothetical protein